ncbi:hypothetical protein S245_056453, partial [Arachis hypogaea]
SEEKPAMRFIYEEIKNIKKKKYEMHFNELRQDKFFSFKIVYELKKQFYACMKRIIENSDLITKIDVKFEDFKTQKEFFSSKEVQNAISIKTLSSWWDSYGDWHPELQQF